VGLNINNSIKQERYSKLSIASLITGVSAVPFGFLVFCMSIGDPQDAGDWIIWYTINSLYWIFFPLPAIVCGSIDLKRIKTGRSSNLGKRLDITGIIIGGVLSLFGLASWILFL